MSGQKFKTGDKVVVPHTDKQYQARVLKSKLEDGKRSYLLHYLGWNKKWDEWVAETDIESAPKSHSKKRAASDRPLPKATKPKQDTDKEETKGTRKRTLNEANLETQLQFDLEIPAILKKQLLDEYDLISTEGRTVTLPRKPNAMQIFRQFYEYGKKELRCTNAEVQMLITGLEEYMDKTLEDFLLYNIEWKTAIKVLSGGVSASSVYGAEHLLRLIVKLPELVPPMTVTVQQSNALHARLQDFLGFLVANRHAFFANVKDYIVS